MSAADLTRAALEGYRSTTGVNPYLYSSPCWYAFSLGDWLARYRQPEPVKASMGRGSRVRIDGTLWSYADGIGWAVVRS